RVYEHIPLLRGVVPIVEERDKRKRGVLNLRKKTRFSLISSSGEELGRTQVEENSESSQRKAIAPRSSRVLSLLKFTSRFLNLRPLELILSTKSSI
ncbi:MAG: hypothetical protein KAW12_26040, partial [Candidatus Aminicenantes bacterium]|nr:hypothetical protein [Candidatus Aminicenantes bacterium]